MAKESQDVYGSSGSVPDQQRFEGAGATNQVRANASEFGGQIGEAVEKTGDQAEALANHYADIYAKSTALDRVTQQSQALGQAEAEFSQLRGNNAVAGLKDFQDKVKQIRDQGSEGLSIASNEYYKSDIYREVDSTMLRAGSHAGEQAEVAHQGSLTSGISNAQNQFALNVNNPTKSQYIHDMAGLSAEQSASLGEGKEMADARLSHNIGAAVFAGIKSQMVSDPNAAIETFNAYKDATYKVPNPDGSVTDTKVPMVDAEHRGAIADYMRGEFNRQYGDAATMANSAARDGQPIDEKDFSEAALRAGKSQEFVNGQLARYREQAQVANQGNTQFMVKKAYENAEAQAKDGVAITVPPDSVIDAAYPKNPALAQEVKENFKDLSTLSSIRQSFGSATPAQNMQTVEALNPATKTATVPTGDIGDAIYRYGEGGNPNSKTSIDGAVGAHQILPGTFDEYKKPGENINNAADNTAVYNRIIADYKQKYGDDPARIATAYFSGTGNVAPAGSPTPWIEDRKDGNGKHVSSYVSDVTKGMGATDVGSYSRQANLYAAAQAALTEHYKALNADPAGVITKNDPIMTAKLQAGLKDPTQLGAYIDSSFARQDALGVAKENQSALPAESAKALVQSITQNPANVYQAFNDLEQKTGSYFPDIYKSMAVQGKLPGQYQVMASVQDPVARKYISDAYAGSEEAQEKTMAKNTLDTEKKNPEVSMKGTIVNAVDNDSRLDQYLSARKASGCTNSQIANYREVAQRLAFEYKIHGDAPADAATHAVDAITKNYTVYGKAIIPSNVAPAVTQAVNNFKADISEDKITIPANAFDTKTYIYDAKKNAEAITDKSETGINFVMPDGTYLREKAGGIVTIPFKQPAVSPERKAHLDEVERENQEDIAAGD